MVQHISCGENQGEGINHPAHYAQGRKYEPIDVIDDWELNFALGNTIKYISRAGRKYGEISLKDLRKAAWYLNYEIQKQEKEFNKIQEDFNSIKSLMAEKEVKEGVEITRSHP